MDLLDLLRYQVKQTNAWLEMTVSDISQEQANWQPPGVANSIGAVYAHLIIGADVGFNSQLHNRMPLIATDFAGQVGLSEPYPGALPWHWHEWASRVHVDWQAFRRYAREVQKSVEGDFDSLSMAELERPVDRSAAGLGIWKRIEFYSVQGINHPTLHGGEIACLKGLQGAPAWPLEWRSEVEPPAL